MTQTPVSTLQSSLTLTEFVDTAGVFPSEGGAESGPFIGSIGIFAGESFLFDGPAEGQTYPIENNTALFSILGTDFGGDGLTNFQLPNLGGVETVGAGEGAGLPFVSLGETLGQTSYDLTTAQLPPSLGGTSAAIGEQQPSLGLNYVINASGVFPSGSLTLDSLGVVSAFAGNFAPGGDLFCDGQLLPISQYTALFSLIGTIYGGNGTTTFALPDLRGRDIVGAGDGFTVGEQVGAANVNLTDANSPLGPDAPVDTQQPGLVMNYYIALSGIFPSEGESGNSDQWTPYLGQIVACAENVIAPNGWALCDGQLLSISGNTALFSVLGTTYCGNGTTTFALPDLQGRTVLGTGGSNGLGTLGQVSGENSVALTSANLPETSPPNFFNSDDKAGILWQGSNGDVELWNPNSSGGFTGQDLGVVPTSFQIAGTGAFDGASEAGILWRASNGDTQLWNANGSGGFTDQDLGVVPTSFQVAGTGDFNGGGEGILWRGSNGDVTLWNANGSGGFTSQDLGVVSTSFQIAGTGDFSGNGDDGILWRNTSNGDTQLWNPNGSGGFNDQDLGVVPTGFQIAGTGDFTGSGEASILWRNTSSGDTLLWNPNGTGGFTAEDLGVVSNTFQIVETGNFTGSGESGILWRNTSSGDTVLWNPNGSGSFTAEDLGVVGTSFSVHKIFA
jgi:microcystin-dependent protein